jgi:hypothetical protein
MRFQRLKINARDRSRCKAQIGQAARRIVVEDDQALSRVAPLKPVMRAAVDLYQVAKPDAPLSQRACLSTSMLSETPYSKSFGDRRVVQREALFASRWTVFSTARVGPKPRQAPSRMPRL